jgi:hypothetical protein
MSTRCVRNMLSDCRKTFSLTFTIAKVSSPSKMRTALGSERYTGRTKILYVYDFSPIYSVLRSFIPVKRSGILLLCQLIPNWPNILNLQAVLHQIQRDNAGNLLCRIPNISRRVRLFEVPSMLELSTFQSQRCSNRNIPHDILV